MSDYAQFAERLDTIAADIDDVAFDQLRAAVADGEIERPVADKRLMQARRSIEKAASLLRQLD
ncbi:MAG: hypothetical protein AAGG08_05095 [Actinomycetota bacterium]